MSPLAPDSISRSANISSAPTSNAVTGDQIKLAWMLWADRLTARPVTLVSLSTFWADQIRLERQPGAQT